MASPVLIFCSKSTWEPAIRREHALARLAVRDGLETIFLERPLDIRHLRGGGLRRFVAGLREDRTGVRTPEGVRIVPFAVPVPGHRSRASEAVAARLLRRRLRVLAGRGSVVVATTPWQWPALDGLPADVRKAFDCADDWSALIPRRRERIRALFRRIGAEADALVLVSEDLRHLFGDGASVVVRNGVDATFVRSEAPAQRGERRLAYTGTLSPRFDAPLVRALLERLEGWSLDLYGQAQYAGLGDRPDAELGGLLDLGSHRVRWHGVVPRTGLGEVIDRATVALLPNRPELSAGQDAMKLYDYASRGVPIVTTPWSRRFGELGPPHLYVGSDADALAEAVLKAATEPPERAAARRAWAARQTWEERWPEWRRAVLGAPAAR